MVAVVSSTYLGILGCSRRFAFSSPPQHDSIDQGLRFLTSDMSQSRNKLIKNRVCSFAAHLFHWCLDLADFDDALVDLIICVGNKLNLRQKSLVSEDTNRSRMYIQS
jgi:hypothetical protein